MKKQLVLNFLVFAEKVEQGILQADLLKEASELGFSKVEIRREYFQDIAKEIPEIKKVAKELQLELFYSVPDEVFVVGKLNPRLLTYLDEAEDMGVQHIKWNIGDFNGELPVAELHQLTARGIEINIENDQTNVSGTIVAIKTFMEAIRRKQIDIGYVYDLGNWRFVGEDELNAAEALKEYVHYIHVKDVAYAKNQPQVAELDQGVINWRKVLAILPQDVPVAIEYPTSSATEILAAKKRLEEE
ncbi:hypothetical protein NRIC_29040 [Enterococcus florum]|uniref:Xylose isomerase-like TIM barrel domain-containing protein n=2 Tax=Enterococcus florum TaxID=2480627 RepID=A0A4P5PPI3_9ENTE|nr:hypothetical protein NRIC_29040 [Enterococcus florum]